jgi:LacI family repressor for deo operon, udp, cdd, tsx, nupC, and nupG
MRQGTSGLKEVKFMVTTIVDVAKLAGVSRSTVSRVLNNSPRVDQETRSRVFKAIEQLNYEPSVAARNLRKQETRMIAVLVPDISNPFFSRLLEGMEEVSIQHGYKIILCITGGDAGRELQYIRLIERKQVDGVILTALRNPLEVIKPYLQYGPIVFANEYLDDDPLPSVSIDNVASSRMVTEHFIELGHRRIAFINGPEHIIICRDRRHGYVQALERAGIPIDDQLVREGDYSMEGGFRCTEDLLKLPSPPTSIFAANDTMAVGVVKALQRQGLNIPEDVAVAGFDNNPYSTVVEPNVTTVDQPINEMGAQSVQLLLQWIEKREEPMESRRVVLQTSLCIRPSSTLL